MALEHAILVSLSEHEASGYDLARRFDRSIGFFWSATHQQIYRVLARMEEHGWVGSTTVPQHGKPAKKVYALADAGREELAGWIASPHQPVEHLRSELAIKLRGASHGDRSVLLDHVRAHLSEHQQRLTVYRRFAESDFPDAPELTGARLDMYLVLRGGMRYEQFFIDWAREVLLAHGLEVPEDPPPDPRAPRGG